MDWLPELDLNLPVTLPCCYCWIRPLAAASQLAASSRFDRGSAASGKSSSLEIPFRRRKTGTSLGIRRNGGPVCRSNNPHNSGIRARKRLQLSGALVDRRLPRVDLPDPRELLSSVDLAQGSILKPSLFISAFLVDRYYYSCLFC
ncbi:hypothetical protein M9H77_19058 [Catharanthus roseus]|uniref:Uncharacterized protein n=1 Tax=Catharanthus roseus TaxID=4058 RepID=A0ACC0B998_CATRO|nr:hypothetical protein M9H77_19058 [Catharanthus roseus]